MDINYFSPLLGINIDISNKPISIILFSSGSERHSEWIAICVSRSAPNSTSINLNRINYFFTYIYLQILLLCNSDDLIKDMPSAVSSEFIANSQWKRRSVQSRDSGIIFSRALDEDGWTRNELIDLFSIWFSESYSYVRRVTDARTPHCHDPQWCKQKDVCFTEIRPNEAKITGQFSFQIFLQLPPTQTMSQ